MNRLADNLMEEHPEEYEAMIEQSNKEIDQAMDNHWNLKVAKEGMRASIYALLRVMDKGSPDYEEFKKLCLRMNEEIKNHDKMLEIL